MEKRRPSILLMGPTKERLFWGPAGNSFRDDSPPSPTFVLGIVEIVAENPSKPGIIAGARACSPLIDGGTKDKSLNWDQ
ncbi:MAG TPA: hypothetical protein VEL71_07825 [Candidatus Dormibacteraeota bacterium]|nr:hypothetical protein [Candidatus Dormibacteraeota bacterium]